MTYIQHITAEIPEEGEVTRAQPVHRTQNWEVEQSAVVKNYLHKARRALLPDNELRALQLDRQVLRTSRRAGTDRCVAFVCGIFMQKEHGKRQKFPCISSTWRSSGWSVAYCTTRRTAMKVPCCASATGTLNSLAVIRSSKHTAKQCCSKGGPDRPQALPVGRRWGVAWTNPRYVADRSLIPLTLSHIWESYADGVGTVSCG